VNLAVFDIDGTLTLPITDEAQHFARAIRNVMGTEHIDFGWGGATHVTDEGIASEAVRRSLDRDLDENEKAKIRQVYKSLMWPAIEKECEALPGAVAFLRDLRASQEIALGIATGNWQEFGIKKLETAGFTVAGIPLATSTDAVARVDIMRHAHQQALSSWQVDSFDRVFYFGDGPWDAEASHALGWGFIGLSTGMSSKDLRELGAVAAFADYHEPSRIRDAILGLAPSVHQESCSGA